MNAHERYKRLTTGRAAELRRLAGNMLVDARDLPTRTQLKAAIMEVLPGGEDLNPVRNAVWERLVALGEAAQDRGRRFTLRGEADEWVLKVAGDLEASERLVPLPPEPTPEEIDGAVARASEQTEAEKLAAELEDKAAAADRTRTRTVRL